MPQIIYSVFLHIYQPPGWDKKIIEKVANESYRPLIKILKARPEIKISLNINASLTEQLKKHRFEDIIQDLKTLASRGQIEFTGSAKYHVILPLLPKSEIIRQIKLNNETNQKIFGRLWQPKGFFMPEMCYSQEAAQVIQEQGFDWIILDEISYQGKINQVNFDRRYKIKDLNLKVIFRNRKISNIFFTAEAKTIEEYLDLVKKDGRHQKYLIVGSDGENLGHHQPQMIKLWADLLDSGKFQTLNMSELLESYSEEEIIEPRPASWASREEELAQNIPYSLWQNPDNPIHQLQWQITNLVIEKVNQAKDDPYFKKARELLDQRINSDQYWWASAQPWWSVEIIEKSPKLLVDTLCLLKTLPQSIKDQANQLSNKIIQMAKEWQKSGQAKKMAEDYLKEEDFSRYFGGKRIS